MNPKALIPLFEKWGTAAEIPVSVEEWRTLSRVIRVLVPVEGRGEILLDGDLVAVILDVLRLMED